MFRQLTARTASAIPSASRTSVRLMTGGSNMHGNDPATIEKEMKRKKSDHPKDSLHEHAPGWNETLASESEAHVKADSHEGTIDVNKTIEYVKKRHADDADATTNQGKSSGGHDEANEVEHTLDPSEKETIRGPLGGNQ